MNLVLLGPPGSGKSTIAKPLIERHNLTLIATGQRLRDEMAARSPIGLTVEPLLDRGELAPDDVMEQLIRSVLAELPTGGGFLMDGYPRTAHQARALERTLKETNRILTAVVNLEVPDDEVVRRMNGRRMCEVPGETPVPIQIDNPDDVERCRARGGVLTQREDDAPALVRQRLAVYHQQTSPLIDFYRERGLVLPIDASGAPQTVIERVAQELAGTDRQNAQR